MIDELCASLIGELVSGRMALPVATDMALVPRFTGVLPTTPSASPAG